MAASLADAVAATIRGRRAKTKMIFRGRFSFLVSVLDCNIVFVLAEYLLPFPF